LQIFSFFYFLCCKKNATLAFKWLDAQNYTQRNSAVYFSANGILFYRHPTHINMVVGDKISLLSALCVSGFETYSDRRQHVQK
jgi:hypothetical protein